MLNMKVHLKGFCNVVSNNVFLSVLVFFPPFLASCDDASDDFPSMRVGFTCSLQQSPYSLLTAPGQFLTITKMGRHMWLTPLDNLLILMGNKGCFWVLVV